MATKTKEQLKAYFRKGMFPTESQFADLIDSLRHIGEKLRMADVAGLADALNDKESRSETQRLRSEFVKVCEEVRKNESTFRLALEALGYSEDMLVEILGIVEKYASLKQDVVNAAGNIMELQRTCKTLPHFSGIVVDLPSGTAVYDSGTSSLSTGAGCAVVFDKSCNRFLLRRAPAGSHPTYYTLWADAESMGLTRDPDPLLPRVFRASEGVAYMATEPPYGLYFLSEQGAVPVPGSLLLPTIEAKVDKEEGKGLSNIVAGEPQTSDNLPSIYTCSREQLKMDLFIDLFNAAAGSKGGYDPQNAPDARHPFLLNGLWLSFEEALAAYVLRYDPYHPKVIGGSSLRTNLVMAGTGYNEQPSSDLRSQCFAARSLEVFDCGGTESAPMIYRRPTWIFDGCSSLRVITGVIQAPFQNTLYTGTNLIEEIRITGIASDHNFYNAKNLSLESIRYMVSHAVNTVPVTIVLHSQAYAQITDEIFELAASKQITLAA